MGDIKDVPALSHGELRKVYEANQNVLRFCKEKLGSNATNEQAAIMHAYELQAGSYVKSMRDDAKYREKKQAFGRALAEIFAPYAPASILEAGVGEATTLAEVAKNLPTDKEHALYAFDLSWSRILIGSRYFAEQTGGKPCQFFTGELEHIALPDNAFDLVFTSHAIEPNHGREREILEELYRVAGGQLILVEPAYELAEDAARERMDYHGYCRGLQDIALSNGWKVTRHEILKGWDDPANPTMVLVIEKNAATRENVRFVSPLGGEELVAHGGHLFCAEEGLVFPVLGGVPYLTLSSGILASHFLES
jgi:ubiquinone/menaquinone biosynthesis C-methylase UbiE